MVRGLWAGSAGLLLAAAVGGGPNEVVSGHLEVGGGKLFYEARGAGPAVVLVHDGLLHRECWDGQWEAFARTHRVVRYDRRGYGRSEAPTKPYSDVEDLR